METNWTSEQTLIIQSKGDITINAVAGSGKTTTLIGYAKAQTKTARILYLAFNKSVKQEAQAKMLQQGLTNVTVETAHSLAFKYIVRKYKYTIKQSDYKTHELVTILGLHSSEGNLVEYLIANHILKFASYFCNSDKKTIKELNYLDLIQEEKARIFVQQHNAYLVIQTRIFLAKMDRGEIDITHDFYLKKLQLESPNLPYDFILFDEAQDASKAMLSLVLQQPATKVIVGDTHQQIYGWRFAINSMEQTNFTEYQLSTSFRFAQSIADLAMAVLSLKTKIGVYKPITISGKGNHQQEVSKAIIARTNLGLLIKAIDWVNNKQKAQKIYFEGSIHSYTYADDGTSLYDILNLQNGNKAAIKDPIIKQMQSVAELENYIEKTEDAQLGMLLQIVEDYGNEIPGILKELKDKQVPPEEKASATYIFSTVHKCKGLEYDSIQLVDDFITAERIESALNNKEKPADLSKLKEEINLLYVAITRTKNTLLIPEGLIPLGFPVAANIKKIVPPKELERLKALEKQLQKNRDQFAVKFAKSNNRLEKKTVFNKAYAPWEPEEDEQLLELYHDRIALKDIAIQLGRSQGAIKSRIEKLELRDDDSFL
jgi:superfamily I DNA/RNA helicase